MAARLQSHPRYYWFLVAFLVAMSALGSFVNDMYTPALPAMSRFFGCSIPTTQMGLTMGMLGLALGQILVQIAHIGVRDLGNVDKSGRCLLYTSDAADEL